MKNILVTGGAGFIGSNFIRRIIVQGGYNITNLDLLTYAGNLATIKDLEGKPNYKFIKGDICDRVLLEQVFSESNIDIVVNFAAESHVDRSIIEPDIFLKTNIGGTQALLDTARKFWAVDKKDPKNTNYRQGVKFLQVSTDEVYGSLGETGYFTENTNLQPNSPYSASKAGADFIVRAYFETFKLPVNITRCSNNYGPYQLPEKLIPLIISRALSDKRLPVYGDGKQVRDWLHVADHCSAIQTVLENGKNGEVYNIGGNNEKQNIEIVTIILKALNKPESLIEYVTDRLGHDRRYAIDNTKITTQLGWKPQYTFDNGVAETIAWYTNNQNWVDVVAS
ncbi:MAG TPA: dTDP-glucose 4,6-dehydratase [Alphaproteobacteria bacterium]|nr:dTDP-glucose 4,6-dehydratase [Alphaproteobacteria bacterium]